MKSCAAFELNEELNGTDRLFIYELGEPMTVFRMRIDKNSWTNKKLYPCTGVEVIDVFTEEYPGFIRVDVESNIMAAWSMQSGIINMVGGNVAPWAPKTSPTYKIEVSKIDVRIEPSRQRRDTSSRRFIFSRQKNITRLAERVIEAIKELYGVSSVF
jgi:hypothetical protein